MAYIGFFDMLGIQSVAEYDYEKYRKSLEIFHEKVNFICSNEAKKQNDSMELNIFSDCAYVESNSLIQLIDFYSALRSELFFDDIFFNASLCMGKLGTSKSDSTFVKSTIFKDTSTVKVYQMQNNFKGIGITIDKDIVVSNKGEKTICNKLVKSFYQPNANELKFIEYWDIKYNRPNSTELAFLLIIQHLITTYSKQKLLNKNAARYYISAISTIISQLNKTDIINENGTTITHTEITKYILSLRSNDYVSYNLFIILFINVLFNKICENDDNSFAEEICFNLLDDFQIQKINLLSEFKEISKIPRYILSTKNKELLSEYLNRNNNSMQL